MARRETLTPLATAERLIAALGRVRNSDLESARIWTKKGTRIYITEDCGPVGYLEIGAGTGVGAIGGDCADRPWIAKVIAAEMTGITVAEPAAAELSSAGAADRIAGELRRRGYRGRVWSKKGVRIYVDSAGGAELGYLEIGDAVANRSQLAKELVDEIARAALGGARVTRPIDPGERRKFLDAIREAPDEDGPRLVYADWLQTHGDPAERARGEMIVAQLAGKDDARWLNEHAERRQAELMRGQAEWTYERGMLTALRASIHDLGESLGRIVEAEPALERLRITSWGSEWTRAHHEAMGFSGAYATGFGTIAPHFGSITHLECVGHDITPSIIELAASPHAARLRYLDIHEAKVGEDAIVAVAKSKALRSLAVLDLRGNALSAAAAEALLSSKLRTLRFGRCADAKLGAKLKAKFPP